MDWEIQVLIPQPETSCVTLGKSPCASVYHSALWEKEVRTWDPLLWDAKHKIWVRKNASHFHSWGDAMKHIQNFKNSQWFWRYFRFLTTTQPSSALCSWWLPAIPCAVLITAVFTWCQLKYAAIIKIFYFTAFLSAQNVWASSTLFLLATTTTIINNNNNNNGNQQKSSQLVLGVHSSHLSFFFFFRGFCWLDSAIQGELWAEPTCPWNKHRFGCSSPGRTSSGAHPCDVAVASSPHPPPGWELGQATSVGSISI